MNLCLMVHATRTIPSNFPLLPFQKRGAHHLKQLFKIISGKKFKSSQSRCRKYSGTCFFQYNITQNHLSNGTFRQPSRAKRIPAVLPKQSFINTNACRFTMQEKVRYDPLGCTALFKYFCKICVRKPQVFFTVQRNDGSSFPHLGQNANSPVTGVPQ